MSILTSIQKGFAEKSKAAKLPNHYRIIQPTNCFFRDRHLPIRISAFSTRALHKISMRKINKKTDTANAMPEKISLSEFLCAEEQEGAKVFASLRELFDVVVLKNIIMPEVLSTYINNKNMIA